MNKFLLGFVAAPLLAAQVAHADLVPFSLTSGGTVSGASYTKTESHSSGGVSFDATLTVLGSNSIDQKPGGAIAGLGIVGNGPNAVSNGEALYFTMTVSNIVGGDVFFDGFSQIDLDVSTGTGALSNDFSFGSTGDNFHTITTASDVVSMSGAPPQSFFAIAAPNEGAGSAFRVRSITGSFSVLNIAAVPEPTAFLFGSLVAGGVGMVVARRRPARKDA
ncbi:hypothetical protein KOR34_20340 [Posidoniimonas corsicana]|uniref:PEP-CTERM protein-sorting domain-containing protein n=1 Tax=Posidoniimonas corsicana TaxID=1938618 RepID=A0A5C5VGL4_9BACT|nr:hypothetical protein [Posidoniimonas corsicana]TWT37087.1 hypothetical protein KOR34_20340 [Posidoniimonas corsicana]